MPGNSPPKHRHDGTSPLPLGMDWSPPPKKWDGRNTVWPHDSHTGWSYCVMIPSWIVRPESGASSDSLLNPVIFYRVQVGMQSPEGFSTSCTILRRFSDFLKLFSALKKAFPKKNAPPPPPKHALLRINSSRLLLEERRYALEEWMGKLLSDIDLSRSASVAAFLELESAARSAFQDGNPHSMEAGPSSDAAAIMPSRPSRASSGVPVADWSTIASKTQSVVSDFGSDSAYETSDLGTPRHGKLHNSESGAEDLAFNYEFTAPIGALSNGALVGESALDQPEELLMSKSHHPKENLVIGRDSLYGHSSRDIFTSRDRIEVTSEQDRDKVSFHARKYSDESTGSEISSVRGSELSIPGVANSIGDGSVDLPSGPEAPSALDAPSSMDMQFSNDVQAILQLDQRHILNRVLITMQRRLVSAKTDMEDLIARLNQEMAAKDYLETKVKDLEGELEVTKLKSKENLQQAILIERERVTQMQWDMDELRRKYLEAESKLKCEESEKTHAEPEKTAASDEKENLFQELDAKDKQLESLQKRLEAVEMKSKADIKVLVKEVKFLRSSQADLKEVLDQSKKEKAELERAIRERNNRWASVKSARKKLFHECQVLRSRLQDCSVDMLMEEEDKFTVSSSSLSDALDLLTTSDNRIGFLLAEAQLLARDDEEGIMETSAPQSGKSSESNSAINGDDPTTTEDEMRKMLTDTLVDNARLRKQVNSVLRAALKITSKPEKEESDEAPSRRTVLNRFLER